MKQLVILSGKGGTGKTTVAAALAHRASRERSVVLADADVDAANLELVLSPECQEEHPFTGGKVAVIDPERCAGCGVCEAACRFDAIHPLPDSRYRVDPLACEGCAFCFFRCPAKAIRMEERESGRWYRSQTRFGPLFHARLFPGQENSGKLVTLVKQQARLWALDAGADLVLVDGPPGIGCPVISASAGADLALLVTEPTVSGVHDLARILATTDHFGIPAQVVLNKADLNPGRADEICAFCARRGVPVVGSIPYDVAVTEAMVQGRTVTEYTDGPVSRALAEVWERIVAQNEF